MEEQSLRHHYIPTFYLQNFTNEDGMFHIYLSKENRFKNNGNLFSPKSHFFEEEGNTLKLGDEPTDILETKFYKFLDSDIGKVFNTIKNSKEARYGLSEKDMPALQYFVAHLFWRNPMNDDYIKNLLKKKSLSDFGIKLVNPKTNEAIEGSEFEKKLLKGKDAIKLIKYWLPTALYDDLVKSEKRLSILSFKAGQKPALIGDNPLIFRNPEKYDVYRDDFILPLSNGKILIRNNRIKSEYSNQIQINIDFLLLKQSNKFVVTTGLNYIPLLNELAGTSINDNRNEVFNELTE